MSKSKPTGREYRFLPIPRLELREDGETPPVLAGYASVFNSEAVIWGMFREVFAPGAYAKTIKEADIRALWNHNTDLVLGRNKAGTLKLVEDDHGLKTEIEPPDTQAGRDAVTSVRRGDVTGMSIMFEVIKSEWVEPGDELPLRVVREAKLWEVSPVTFPAYEETSIGVRAPAFPDTSHLILDEAFFLARGAELGMPLTKAQRQTIAAARGLYTQLISEPEPGAEAQAGNHSGQESEPGSHSEAWQEELIVMARRLKAVQRQDPEHMQES